MRFAMLASLVLAIGCAGSQERLSDAVGKLRKGMTRQDVHEALGNPMRISYKDTWTVWTYRFTDDRDNLRDAMNGGNSARANARLLALAFDPDGHLQSWETN